MVENTSSAQSSDRREILQQALNALDKMKKKLDDVDTRRREPIAIIGMGCRLPGGIRTPEQYWEFLIEGKQAIRRMPKQRWEMAAGHISDAAGKAPWGGFLEDIEHFDAHFFGISRREAESMDPQQRLILEVGWEAIERAGIDASTLKGSNTGLFVGVTTTDYSHIALNQDPESLDAYTATGSALNVIAGRFAYVLGLSGPAMAIDTACSSSLVALHLACQSLRLGESEMALAGGVNVLINPEPFLCFNKWGMMAPDGRCKTFDAAADGFVRSEGCGLLVLKRLSDAEKNGDQILALIRGSAVNQDGRSSGLTVPNGPAQEAVIRAALASAGLTSEAIGYVEAHGTGTRLGDPIELEALTNVLTKDRTADQPLWVGSVKTNLGHLESASGVAGVMKVILALQKRMIPPHLHFHQLSDQIQIGDAAVEIPTMAVSWESRRIAGVSSFGFSGTNAHIILESAGDNEIPKADQTRPLHIVTASARDTNALSDMARNYGTFFLQSVESEGDLSFSANTGRKHHKHRIAVVGDSCSDIGEKLHVFSHGEVQKAVFRGSVDTRHPTGVAFLFTGQGSQYTGMGRLLYDTQPTFSETMNTCDEILHRHLGISLLEMLYPERDQEEEQTRLLNQTRYSQPAIFMLEYALARLWQTWGVIPSHVMGHSVGEYVAACVAGLFSLEDGLVLISERGRLMQALPSGGQMRAVFADEKTVLREIEPYRDTVSIAAVNGPENTVISGVEQHISIISESLSVKGIGSVPLRVSHAFHSPMMDPMLDDFERAAAQVHFGKLEIPLISALVGQSMDASELSQASWWRRHVREPVLFSKSIQTLYDQGCRLFVEIGPNPTLSSMASRCLPQDEIQWLPSLHSKRDDWRQMLDSLGALYVKGVDIDWQGFDCDYARRKVALPTYPFQHERYWIPSDKKRIANRETESQLHPLVHYRIRSPKLDGSLVFQTVLDIKSISYFKDHCIFGQIVVPATAYLEMAQAAGRFLYDEKPFCVANFEIQLPLFIGHEGRVTVQVIVTTDEDDAGFEIFSLNEQFDNAVEWPLHARGRMRPVNDLRPGETIAITPEITGKSDAGPFYERLAASGVQFGPWFKGLVSIDYTSESAVGYIRIPDVMAQELGEYHFHPALLDTCIQVLGAAVFGSPDGDTEDVYLPIGLKRYRVYSPGSLAACSVGTVRKGDSGEVILGDVHVFDLDGSLLADIEGMRFRRARKESFLQNLAPTQKDDWLHRLQWQQLDDVESDTESVNLSGRWIVFCQPNGFGAYLPDRLRMLGASVHQVSPGAVYSEPSLHQTVVRPDSAEDMRRLIEKVDGDQPQKLQGIVYLWNTAVEAPKNDALSAESDLGWPGILSLVQSLLPAGKHANLNLSIVTTGGVSIDASSEKCNAAQAMLWGLGRVIASELPVMQCKMLDVLPEILNNDQQQAFINEIIMGDRTENQVALRKSGRFGLRLVQAELTARMEKKLERPYQLHPLKRGVIEDFDIRPLNVVPPRPGEIQIELEMTSMNFRDVLNVLGMYPGEAGPLGNECVGRVSALGNGVQDFNIGDPVLAITPQAYCSHVNTRAELAIAKPDQISMEVAATLPITFLTAEYALTNVAAIKRGDKVLIHAAAGGVGMAAIQIAKRSGAQIFATAGSSEKRRMLRTIGIEHVFNSRTLDFADSIMEITRGRGVDIVLNSLAGEFIDKSISILSKGGRFIEIGKIDLREKEKVALANPDVTYTPFLLGDVCQNSPSLIQTMFKKLVREITDGILEPLPVKSFSISHAVDAFRFMAQAKHVGKIVVDHKRDVGIRPDAAYVITGGTGGLGLHFAQWLVKMGVNHLILISRNEPGREALAVIHQLENLGAKVVVANVDVGEYADLERVLSSVERPIKGIIHAAGVIDDATLNNLDKNRFKKVLRAKVHGGWNLHRLTEKIDLDFFIMCSSASSVFGSVGQGNYAAANAFLDAMAQYRRHVGLPALSINWGPWSEVGMAAGLSEKERLRWEQYGIKPIKPEAGLLALETAMAQGEAQLAVLNIDWHRNLSQIPNRDVPAFFSALVLDSKTMGGKSSLAEKKAELRDLIRNVHRKERWFLIQTYLKEQLRIILGLKEITDIDEEQNFIEMGMDSIMSVELSSRLSHSCGCSIITTIAFDYNTLNALTDYLISDVLTESDDEVKGPKTYDEDREIIEL